VVAAFYLAFVTLLRSSTFFHSYENWDESLFLLMGRSLLDGHSLYGEIWDHKPPGVFVLFALAQALLGRSVLSIRILACVTVASSSLLLFVIGRSLRSQLAGLLAGLLYAVFTADYGRPTNLELVFAPLVLAAFAIALRNEPEELLARPALPLGLGLAGGLALQVSFVAVFDLAALGLFLLGLFVTATPRPSAARLVRFIALAAIGPIGVLALTAAAFAVTGHWSDYVEANFASNARYVADTGFDGAKLAWMIQRRIREAFPLWLGLALAPLCLIVFPGLDARTRRGLHAGLLWTGGALVGISATRYFFAHYFLDLLPAQCLVCALVVALAIEEGARGQRTRSMVLAALVLLGPMLRAVEKPLSETYRQIRHRWIEGIPNWGDEPAQVAAYLRPRIGADDVLYVADYQPILYYLLPAKIPSKFLFPAFLVDDRWRGLAGQDSDAEVRAIFAKRPLYVVKGGEAQSPFYRVLRDELDRGYRLEQTIGTVELYRRRDER
jgi:4-amino-4-deoxy-L-arabinose transferase-like glycosyltransferase